MSSGFTNHSNYVRILSKVKGCGYGALWHPKVQKVKQESLSLTGNN